MFSNRLKTSTTTSQKLEEIYKTLRLSSKPKAAIARIAIGLSLKHESDPRLEYETQILDNSGLEFQRTTLLGNYEDLYKIIIIEHLNKYVSDEEYFPKLVKAHLERGIFLLYSELKMAGNKEKLLSYLLSVQP
jgi:DNA sulfur modification protein DndE